MTPFVIEAPPPRFMAALRSVNKMNRGQQLSVIAVAVFFLITFLTFSRLYVQVNNKPWHL